MKLKPENKKILNLNESVQNVSTADIYAAVETFISEFSDTANSWMDATQEIADIARWIEEVVLIPIPDTKSKTPAEYNIKYKTYIRENIGALTEHYLKLLYDRYDNWFKKYLTESEEVADEDLKQLVLSKPKQFVLDCGLFFETIKSGKLSDNKLSLAYHKDVTFDFASFLESVRSVVTFAQMTLTDSDIQRLESHYNKYI